MRGVALVVTALIAPAANFLVALGWNLARPVPMTIGAAPALETSTAGGFSRFWEAR